MAEVMEIGITPKRIPLKPGLSVWDNLKEYLPNCSITRIIYCLLQRGWKYSDMAHILGSNKHTISQYLRRWDKVCIQPSLKIGKCIDCERYIKILKLFGIDIHEIERNSWFWGESNE